MSWCCVFHWTLCRVRGYLCDEKPTWGWLDTWPQLFIRPPTVFFLCVLACIWLYVCLYAKESEAALHPCEPSHVNDTRLQGILSLFVLLAPQGPPLAPISFHLCLPCQMRLRIPFKLLHTFRPCCAHMQQDIFKKWWTEFNKMLRCTVLLLNRFPLSFFFLLSAARWLQTKPHRCGGGSRRAGNPWVRSSQRPSRTHHLLEERQSANRRQGWQDHSEYYYHLF